MIKYSVCDLFSFKLAMIAVCVMQSKGRSLCDFINRKDMFGGDKVPFVNLCVAALF